MYIESNDSKNLVKKNKQKLDLVFSTHKKYSSKVVLRKIFSEVFQTLIYSGIERTFFKIKCRLNPKMIYDKIANYNPDDYSELNYECKGGYKGGRIAIYTAIFGDYDELKEPLYISPVCDYFVFTDLTVPSESVWKKIDASIYKEVKDMDGYHKAKFVKILPHKFFREYEYSIWLDGTATIAADLVPFVDRMTDKCIAMFDNPIHDCIYTESNFLLYYNRVSENKIKQQIEYYRKIGYPSHNGMFECTVIVRRHNEFKCVKLMEEWWNEICSYTMRDQISFPVIMWKNNLRYNDVEILGNDRHFCPRLKFDSHKKTITFN